MTEEPTIRGMFTVNENWLSFSPAWVSLVTLGTIRSSLARNRTTDELREIDNSLDRCTVLGIEPPALNGFGERSVIPVEPADDVWRLEWRVQMEDNDCWFERMARLNGEGGIYVETGAYLKVGMYAHAQKGEEAREILNGYVSLIEGGVEHLTTALYQLADSVSAAALDDAKCNGLNDTDG